MTSLSVDSALKLASGNAMARLGFGVYQAKGSECENAVAEAIKAGYRHSECDGPPTKHDEDTLLKRWMYFSRQRSGI